jgi:VWFA-related protein
MWTHCFRPSAWLVCLPITLFLASRALPQTAPGGALIQTGTHIVLVSVVAKDKHGKPVADLTRDDFVLRDNGEEQKFTFFTLEQAGDTAAAVGDVPARLTFTNRPGPGMPSVTVFLFDELNTRLTDQELAKKDFLHYLRGLPADSRTAVFLLGDSLSLLHDFSQDMASLVAALEKHTNRMNPEVDAATAPPASADSIAGIQSTDAQWDSFIRSSSQPYVDYTETVRATRTAAALEAIAGHLQGIPGRKTLIWISGGFPVQLGLRNSVDSIPQSSRALDRPAGGGRRGGGASAGTGGGSGANSQSNSSATGLATSQLPGMGQSFETDVARAIRALNEADVAVYPVDARGITTPAPFQADRSSIGKRSRPPKAVGGTDFNYETLERPWPSKQAGWRFITSTT